MGKGRKGWWKQIQSGEYPETQKNYGDSNWIIKTIIKSEKIKPTIQNDPIKLQGECPNCKRLYWIDKEKCINCGWTDVSKKKLEKKIDPFIHKEEESHKTEYKPEVSVICPKCESKMVLRTAKKGVHKGSFGGVQNIRNVKQFQDIKKWIRAGTARLHNPAPDHHGGQSTPHIVTNCAGSSLRLSFKIRGRGTSEAGTVDNACAWQSN